MLPLAASYAKYNSSFIARAERAIQAQEEMLCSYFSKIAEPKIRHVITLSH